MNKKYVCVGGYEPIIYWDNKFPCYTNKFQYVSPEEIAKRHKLPLRECVLIEYDPLARYKKYPGLKKFLPLNSPLKYYRERAKKEKKHQCQ